MSNKEAERLAERLRAACTKLRTSSMPLADMIPLMQEAADALAKQQAPEAAAELTAGFVQPVPDHCDRITWRNQYYHLPLKSRAAAEPAAEPVAWRDPQNDSPAQGCTYRKETAEKWPHIYRQPLYAAPQKAEGNV